MKHAMDLCDLSIICHNMRIDAVSLNELVHTK
jgi:hypothetical protein